MRIVKIAALVLAVAAVLGIAAIYVAYVIGQKPTHGPRIRTYENPTSALLVIDVQEDYTGPAARPPFPYPNADSLIKNINRAIDHAHDKGFVIAYIRQELPQGFVFRLMSGNRGIISTPGVKLDKRLQIVNDNNFPKSFADAFSNRDLEHFLVRQQVNTIFICGLDAVHCVNASALGAVNRGYRAAVIEGAIATIGTKPMATIKAGYLQHGVDAVSIDAFCMN